MSDVLDILSVDRPSTPEVTKESILGTDGKKKRKRLLDVSSFKRPEGMHRELYALLYADHRDPPPLMSTDTGQGYKQVKAKLGLKKVRPWKWMPFTNPARKDAIFLCHWRRVADESKDYPFARFNKVTIQIPTYTDTEYQQLLSDTWSRADTDYLMEMCKQYDQRFVIIHDRWDKTAHGDRSIEDMKERYYSICNALARARGGPDVAVRAYDADHERRRKDQLNKLYHRTQEQVEEEQTLLSELRKIEQRKREREKKTQDLQKLITAADSSSTESRKTEKKGGPKKRFPIHKNARTEGTPLESTGIKFPDVKSCGVSLRSHRMKLPTTVGQRKTKTIEQLLQELGIDLNPMPTEEMSLHFNELRSDMVLLYELKLALATCEFELQTLRHQYEALAPPGKVILSNWSLLLSLSEDTPGPAQEILVVKLSFYDFRDHKVDCDFINSCVLF
ncbi:DMAP1 [Cordylochernes scorpioides]|uniref:DMAP1 n=1 Tax=Cordylochernes scorpioides TaxID=51811 RepID=A0ABY6KFJ4_9ARAC|nr:DMAP1 [Cordylochernes scorpioides]